MILISLPLTTENRGYIPHPPMTRLSPNGRWDTFRQAPLGSAGNERKGNTYYGYSCTGH